MMQIIKCKNCGNSHVGFDKTFVNVEFKTNIRCCDHCNNIREEIKSIFYCSVECYHNSLKNDIKRGDF